MNSAVMSQKHRVTVCFTDHMAETETDDCYLPNPDNEYTQSCILKNHSYRKKTSSIFYFPLRFLEMQVTIGSKFLFQVVIIFDRFDDK